MSLKGKPLVLVLSYILANPFYIGKIQFAKYKDWSEKRRGLNDKPVIAEGKHSPLLIKIYGIKYKCVKTSQSKTQEFMVRNESAYRHYPLSPMWRTYGSKQYNEYT